MSGRDFYEDDEPAEQVFAAFDATGKHRTTPPGERRIIDTVPCPKCGARVGEPCWAADKPPVGSFDTTIDTFTPLELIHDERAEALRRARRSDRAAP